MSFVEMNENNRIRPEGIPCLLIYGYNEEEKGIIQQLANTLDIQEVKEVTPKIQNNLVEDILTGNTNENSQLTSINEYVIIFNDLAEYDIHSFIAALKGTDLKRPIYAVGAPPVRRWPFNEWVAELMQEREEMMKQQIKNR